jgi:hypothetical protein
MVKRDETPCMSVYGHKVLGAQGSRPYRIVGCVDFGNGLCAVDFIGSCKNRPL